MCRPAIANQPISLMYNILSIYVYNIQYSRFYSIVSSVCTHSGGFKGVVTRQMVFYCIKIILTIIFYMVVDCSQLVFLILMTLVKALISNSGCVHVYLVKSINSMIEESFLHTPKIKIILFIKNIGIRINPSKKDLFNQTSVKFKLLRENFSPDLVYNAIRKDWFMSNIKNIKLSQCNVTTTKMGGGATRDHFCIVNSQGFGITTCTNPPREVDFLPIGKNAHGKIIYGYPLVLGKGSAVTNTRFEVNDEVAILYIKDTFRGVGSVVGYIETSGGGSKTLTTSRSEFIKGGEFPEFLMTPHFSNSELKQLKNSGLFNDYFDAVE